MVPEMSDAPVNYGIGITEWTRTRGGQYQSPPVVRFSQRDVDDGYIWYKDQGRNINGNTESFQYEVTLLCAKIVPYCTCACACAATEVKG